MQILHSLTVLLATAATAAEAFKIRTFPCTSCNCISSGEHNIWDNTCRTAFDSNFPTFRSFRVLNYGAGRQHGDFYFESICSYTGGPPVQSWYVDGSDDEFVRDACLTLDNDVSAAGSRSL